jgi:gliding motility-associated-like protein
LIRSESLCQYSAAPVLPGISLNGITGTWNPAWINTTNPGTFTFTFTPNDPGQCGTTITMDVMVIPEISPEFEPIGPLCQFSEPPVLPDTCLQGVPGTWNPPVVSTDVTGIFFFTFTPDDAIPCVLPVTITIEVISDIVPEFDPIGPLCQNSVPPALPGISNNGITGTWDPPVINTSVVGEFTYIFTPDDGQCAVETEMEIEISEEIIPEFDPVGPLCQGSTPSALPGTSLNNITGTWEPPIPDTGVPGTFTFVFTPDNPEQCGVETTMDITVVTEIIPEFDPIGPLCQGSTPSALPGTSLNNITGTWEPPIPDTDEPGTFTFTFTPDDPEQCGVETSMDITITDNITPLFDPIGPLCIGSAPPALPGESTNTPPITGTWQPALIDTSVPGSSTYTFTPDAGQCAAPFDMIIVVTDEITPLFAQIGPLCQLTTPPPLPAASNNAPPITGTWSPSSIDTSVPGLTIFTFTPDEDQCAVSTSMAIEVLENVVPLFDQIGPLSQNTTPPLLPASSNNTPAITGTWNPPFIDTSVPGTYNYIFTPDPGQCASITDMNITVLFDYLQAITGSGEHCMGDAAIVPIVVDKFHGVATFQLKLSYNVDKLNCEGYISIHPALASHLTGWIDQVAGDITLQWQDISPLTFTQPETVLELVFTPKEAGLGLLQWYTGETESFFHDLNGGDIPAEFYTSDLTIYNAPEIILAESKTVCDGERVTIIGIASSSQPPISYIWTYPNGDTTDIDPFFSSVSYADAGYYTLEATDALGCTDLKTIQLIVSDNPVASFHGSDTLTVPEDYILDAGPGPVSYLWNTGETGESIVIDSTGLYWVEMVTGAGCVGIDSVFIFVIEDEIPSECMFVPNAFTPNNDGLNDTFKAISGCPLSFFRMEIYNRWGELLFKSTDINEGWDGTKGGKLCPGDAYVYKIAYTPDGIPGETADQVKVGMVVIIDN